MMGFKVKHIENLCWKITDGSHFSPENDTEGIYPMYSVKDMDYNGFALYGYKTIGKEVFEKLCKADCRPLKNDVLIAKDGSYLKYVFKAKQTLNACILSSIAILRPDIKVIDPDYFVYILRTKSVKNAMANYVSGSALPRIILSDFKKMKVRIEENVDTQRRIASILSAYDNLIENNNRRIRLLEQMAENLYKEWFVRFRFPGHEKAEFENGLPKGWKVERIGDVCETIGGGTPSTTKPEYWNGGIKWVTPTDITTKTSLPLLTVEGRITEEGLKNSSAKLLPPYTILMTSRASIGYFGLAPCPVCTNQGFISIIPRLTNTRMYILYTLMARKEEIIMNANGATFLEISKGRFRKLKIVIPNDQILASFEKVASDILMQVLKIEKQSKILSRQRDLLLPRLMSGKLEVKV